MEMIHRLAVSAGLVLLCITAQSAAQPISIPVCLGDASSWHIQTNGSNLSGNSPPVIRTIGVEKDTMANGEVYVYLSFPDELRLPAIWARSDSSGMHHLTDAGDSLFLPAFPLIGTSVLWGTISDTLTVATSSGFARAYQITRIDSLRTLQWIIADGIGLWDFMTRVNYSNYERCRFLSGRRCGMGPSTDPVPIEVPHRTGDVLVHGPGPCQIQSARNSYGNPYWVGFPGPPILHRQNRSFDLTMTMACVVRVETRDFFGPPSGWFEYYPSYIPATDSILLDELSWKVMARFDTSIFNETVKAFTLVRDERYGRHTMTITDRFGVIYEDSPGYQPAYLESAVVNSVKYNRNTVRRRLFPLCYSNVYEYTSKGDSWRDTVRIDLRRDTLINGIEYRYFELPTIPLPDNPNARFSDLSGWFRETPDGLERPDSSLAFPATADLGDATAVGVIVSISRKKVNGTYRYLFAGADVGHEYQHQDTIVEGLGLIRSKNSHMIGGVFDWQLTGAIICDESWGIPLAVSETPLPPERFAMQLYPNPAPAGMDVIKIRVAGVESGTGQLSVHDLLGRELRNRFVNCDPTENEFSIPLDRLPAGMYMVRLQTRTRTVLTNLLLLR